MDDYFDLHHKLNDFIKCICSQQFILIYSIYHNTTLTVILFVNFYKSEV